MVFFPSNGLMKKGIYHILCIVVAILAVGCTGGVSDQKDYTACNEEITAAICDGNTERALAIIDSAEAISDLDHFNAELLRCKVYSDNESTIDTARVILERLIRQEHLSVEQQAAVLEQLVYVARLRQQDESILKYGTQYIDVCHQLGKETKALETQSIIGSSLVRIGRTGEGLSKIDDAITQLDKVSRFTETDACIRAIKSKIRTLIDLERYKEIIPMGERILEKLDDYVEHPDAFADGSERMPSDDRRPGYIDFYRGQAYAFIAYAYAMDNQTSKAHEYLRNFEQTEYSRTFDGKKVISATWCEMGMYDKMLAFYDEKDRAWSADTLHRDYAITLYNRAIAARSHGQYQKSDNYMKRYADLQKYLNNAERIAAAQEYAARYHEQEQQLAFEKEQSQKKRMGMIVWFLGIMVLIAAVFIVVILRQMFSIRKKNAVLSKEIIERVEYEDKKLKQTLPVKGLEELTDSELFEYIKKVVLEENLHLDSQFDRQKLVERLHLSKERIGAAFAQGSMYPTMKHFLNEVRLFHSTKLLTEHPEMSITDVALSSGFSNGNTFARNFKDRFAITPREFREKKR